MANWVPMFAMPNVQVQEPIETDGMALVSMFDPRIKALTKQHKNYGLYIRRFSNEFGQKIAPSTILVRDDAPTSFWRVDAMASFRDVIALSTVPYTWAHIFEFGHHQDGPQYSNTFAFYPWLLDKNYEHVAVQSIATIGIESDVKKMRAQSSPALRFTYLLSRMVDTALLNALLIKWQRRYTTDKPTWKDRALFRSLNMANAAGMLPAHAEITHYDLGRHVALWVSAYEILAHPANDDTGFRKVYALLEKVKWNNSHCNTARYKVYPYTNNASLRILPCWVYGELHRARNDFLHGNPVQNDRLVTSRSKRRLLFYAPVLYRMALAAFLDLRWKERKPSKKNKVKRERYDTRQFKFQVYQRNMESALGSIIYTPQEWEKLKAGTLSWTSPAIRNAFP
jgi:hypothetical protein